MNTSYGRKDEFKYAFCQQCRNGHKFCPGYPALSKPVDTQIYIYRQLEDRVSVVTICLAHFDGQHFLKSRHGFWVREAWNAGVVSSNLLNQVMGLQ